MTVRDCDVMIVGAGMVGLTTALSLKHYGIQALVIDRNPCQVNEQKASSDAVNIGPSEYASRVSAISLASQRLLTTLNVWQHIIRKTPYVSMSVWEDQGFGKIQFHASQINQTELGCIIENKVLITALEKSCKEQSIDVLRGVDINAISTDDDTKMVFVQDTQGKLIKSNLVIGADGANSYIRKHAQFSMTTWDYDHIALVANVRTEHPHDNIARQAFSPHGPLALLPMPDPNVCSFVWSQDVDVATSLVKLEPLEFCKSIQIVSDNCLGKIELLTEIGSYPLTMRYCREWAKNGLTLVGDAAHTIHPLAGQGVNLGLVDAAALAEELFHIKNAGKSIFDQGNLMPYQRWRKTDAAKVVATMEVFKQLFSGDDPAKKMIRNIGLASADKFSPLKQFFIQQATGGNGKTPELMR